MKTTLLCLECGIPISRGVNEFSRRIYGHSLCMKDQFLIEETGATAYAIDLYLALKERNFPIVLEYYDGHKHVDMALPGKLYIEINGSYHRTKQKAMFDFTRSVYSLEQNVPTIIIPNSLLENQRTFSHALEELCKACKVILGQRSLLSSMLAITEAQLQ
jgi:hypothetical protein